MTQPTIPGVGVINNLDWLAVGFLAGLVDSVPVLNASTQEYEQSANPPVIGIRDGTTGTGTGPKVDTYVLSYLLDLWDDFALNKAEPDVIDYPEVEGTGFISVGTLA